MKRRQAPLSLYMWVGGGRNPLSNRQNSFRKAVLIGGSQIPAHSSYQHRVRWLGIRDIKRPLVHTSVG